jgi:hypothetical protein
MRRVPKKFFLLGHEITVRIVSKRDWDALCEDYDIEGAVGAWRHRDHAIILLRQPRSQLLHTFAHELTHAILDMMNDKLSYNEKWVDQFGGLLAQALDTSA